MRKNKILKSTGEYLSSEFKGENGNWVLIGSESTGPNDKPITCIDTFKNNSTGKIQSMIRKKVYDLAEANKIFY